jgi:hypothetical protein
LWWNGILNAGLASEWHWKQSAGCGAFSRLFFFLALMNAVAANTADVRLGVGRAVKVRVRSRVTGQALGVNLFGRVLRGIEYLAYIAAARHVLRTGTVAALATLI